MNYNELYESDMVDFSDIPAPFFLLGLLSAFDNSYQATADAFFGDLSWKQVFAIVCIDMCREAPTLRELSLVMGSSHQNVKQILLKLEKKGFVTMQTDEMDRRKQRIFLTEKAREFSASHDEQSQKIVGAIFEGIPQEALDVTIQTILHMERNLKSL
ncbi:MAG: winged helix DNA-binding protein [Lachnospiraceae bacterium]|nr:winged helix DNA-binding protein [Lachnospiraceae bacterium]